MLPLCVNFTYLRRMGKEIFVYLYKELTKKRRSGRKQEKLELRAKLKSIKLI